VVNSWTPILVAGSVPFDTDRLHLLEASLALSYLS
jgi:hypothetical protein